MLSANVFKLFFFSTHVYSQNIQTNLYRYKQRGSKCLDKCWKIKKVSQSTREPSSSGREHLTHSGRNWQELGLVQYQVFLAFGKFCLFQVRITNILPGFVWTEGVYFIQYMCVCVCLWSTCLIVCACLWPSSIMILYFCKCLTHVLKGLQWMLTDEKSRADFTKFGFGDPDEIISQRWITYVF